MHAPTQMTLDEGGPDLENLNTILDGLQAFVRANMELLDASASHGMFVLVDLMSGETGGAQARPPNIFAIRLGAPSPQVAPLASAEPAMVLAAEPEETEAAPLEYPHTLWQKEPAPLRQGLSAAADVIDRVLGPVTIVKPDFAQMLEASTEPIFEAVSAMGIGAWQRAVCRHESRTFRHCMLVTGYAAAYAHALKFSATDRDLFLIAALLHDAGKAEVPLLLLDKPGRLDQTQVSLVRSHAKRGHRILVNMADLHPDVLDVALHHHEFLDGSGYPDRLKGPQISDLVRLATITDVFATLVDACLVKGMPVGGALRCIEDMSGKLDQVLVGVFRSVIASSA